MSSVRAGMKVLIVDPESEYYGMTGKTTGVMTDDGGHAYYHVTFEDTAIGVVAIAVNDLKITDWND